MAWSISLQVRVTALRVNELFSERAYIENSKNPRIGHWKTSISGGIGWVEKNKDRESRNQGTKEAIKSIFRDIRIMHPGGREKIHGARASQLLNTTRCN